MNRRKTKLISPRLQLRMAGVVVLCSASALLIQYSFLRSELVVLASGDSALAAEVTGVLRETIVLSAALWLPMMFGLWILYTHRLAGPLHRMGRHLESVAAGERPGPCHLRDGDQLHDLCENMNRALDAAYATDPSAEDGDRAGSTSLRRVG
jgi:hypothetical protein